MFVMDKELPPPQKKNVKTVEPFNLKILCDTTLKVLIHSVLDGLKKLKKNSFLLRQEGPFSIQRKG